MAYSVPIVDFVGPLTAIGQNIGNMSRERQLRNAFAGFNGNYDEAANKLMQMGLVDEATRLFTAGQLAKYRDIQGQVAVDKAQPSVEDQIIQQWWNSQQPNRLGPSIDQGVAAEEAEASGAVPSGVPGVSVVDRFRNAPAAVTNKLAPAGVQKQLEEEGKKAGAREAFRSALTEASPQVNELVNSLVNQVREADTGTFEHALGPLQGVPPSEDWRQTITSGIPQTLGSVANYLEKGYQEGFLKDNGDIKAPGELSGGYTDTLRSKVISTQASLVGIMQRLLRVPGIGSQSDYELRQIIAQAGELSKARTKEDFQDRLQNVLHSLKAIGIPLDIPTVEQVAGPGSKSFAEHLPAVNKVQTVPISPSGEIMAPANTGGGVSVPGATRNPNGAYTGPAPAGTVMSNGTQTIIKGADGRWYDQKTKKPLPMPRP